MVNPRFLKTLGPPRILSPLNDFTNYLVLRESSTSKQTQTKEDDKNNRTGKSLKNFFICVSTKSNSK